MKANLRILYESLIDLLRYMQASPLLGRKRHEIAHLEGNIIRLYHVIEKGLAMPDFRERFGINLVQDLVNKLEKWKSIKPNKESIHFFAAEEVLRNYYYRHYQLGIEVADIIPSSYTEKPKSLNIGGIKPVPSIDKNWTESFSNVVRSRVSVRNFDKKRIPTREIIQSAVKLAIVTPSVCNRQTWRVHVYKGEKIQELLSLQNGNRGFSHTIPTLLIITTDMRYFTGAIERYQPWIDGGMFSMTLLLALHSLGLGAVSLNWSVLNSNDKKMRERAKIPDYERIIMLIGCGYPQDSSFTPNSVRAPLESFVTWN